MRRAERLFQIVQELRARRFATARDLGLALGVSERTIYRDVRDLERSGIPVLGEAGVGYRLSPGFELPPLTFNAAEIEALVLGMRMVESWGDGELGAAARSVMAKASAVLPAPLRRLLVETPLFAPGVADPANRTAELTPLRKGIAEARKLRIGYLDVEDRRTDRVVRPLALYFWGRKWTLGAWCELRSGYRNFRPDRIVEVQVLPDRFTPDDGASLAGYVAEMEGEAARQGFPSFRGTGG